MVSITSCPLGERMAVCGTWCQVYVASGSMRQELWALDVECVPADNCLDRDRWRRVLHVQSAASLRLWAEERKNAEDGGGPCQHPRCQLLDSGACCWDWAGVLFADKKKIVQRRFVFEIIHRRNLKMYTNWSEGSKEMHRDYYIITICSAIP